LAVDFAAVPDLDDQDDEDCVLYLIYDAVIADSHTVKFLRALELGASRRARVIGQFRYGITETSI
jgi:hypothetical protein